MMVLLSFRLYKHDNGFKFFSYIFQAYVILFFFCFFALYSLMSLSTLAFTRAWNPGYGSYPKTDWRICIHSHNSTLTFQVFWLQFSQSSSKKVAGNNKKITTWQQRQQFSPRATRRKEPWEKLGLDCLIVQELVSVSRQESRRSLF